MMDIRHFIQSSLPLLIKAGDYALQVQNRIKGTAKLDYATASAQAVTDADLSIQNFFEVWLLAQYPQVSFYGEEESRNLFYFPDNSEYIVSLDPINHTLAFKDGLTAFDIILSISSRTEGILGAVVYLPADGEFFMAIKNEGGFQTTKHEVEKNVPWKTIRLQDVSRSVLIYNNFSLKKCFNEKFKVVDLCLDYNLKSWDMTISAILRGNLSGFAVPGAHIIDWGAIGFIVSESGGAISDFRGNIVSNYWNYPERKVPELLAATDEVIHSELLQLLKTF